MNVYQWLGRVLNLDQVQNVADYKFSFAASSAQRAPMLMLFGFVGLVALAAVFYFRHQPSRYPRWRFVLFLVRAAVLCQVLLLLAEPILTLTIHGRKRPALWVLFDGTDSMNIADDLPPEVPRRPTRPSASTMPRPDEDKSPGETGAAPAAPRRSRVDYLRALGAEEGPEPAGLAGQAVPPAGVPFRVDARRPLAGTAATARDRSTASTWLSSLRPMAR